MLDDDDQKKKKKPIYYKISPIIISDKLFMINDKAMSIMNLDKNK